MRLLDVQQLAVDYGGLHALVDVDLHVDAGEIVSVIGPNGAGKTTLFKAISGIVPAKTGSVHFDGADLLATHPSKRAHLGIAHVPEGRRVFKNMTIRDNLETGRLNSDDDPLDEVFALFPKLKERSSQIAGTLSGGEQQMLAVGRGLMSRPRLLMLDEPSMGLAPTIADEIFERIEEISRSGDLTVLLVEQRAAEAMDLAHRTYVLNTGQIVLSGPSADIRNEDSVRRAYLGM